MIISDQSTAWSLNLFARRGAEVEGIGYGKGRGTDAQEGLECSAIGLKVDHGRGASLDAGEPAKISICERW